VEPLSQGTRDKLRGVMGAALRAAGTPDEAIKGGLNAAAAAPKGGQRSEASTKRVIPGRRPGWPAARRPGEG